MSCAVEMLRCEACGQEVNYFQIRVVLNDEGKRAFVCAECNGEEETPETSTTSC